MICSHDARIYVFLFDYERYLPMTSISTCLMGRPFALRWMRVKHASQSSTMVCKSCRLEYSY